MPKIITALALASLVALPLVGCVPAEQSCEVAPSGSHSDSIKVSGPHAGKPDVTMPNAFDVATTERSVVIKGEGIRAGAEDVVTAMYAIFNASTGEAVEVTQGSTWSTVPFVLGPFETEFPGIFKSLNCAQVGDRIVSTIPPSELFGELGPELSGGAIGVNDTTVFVFDVLTVSPAPTAAPDPAPEPSVEPVPLPTPAAWVDNVPTVDLSGDVPVVTLPDAAAPSEFLLKVITEGTGELVADKEASVTIDYQGTSWEQNAIFDQSYTRGQPSSFGVSGVISGFAAAMIGQKVGSTLLVTIPPEFAYGTQESSTHALAGQTLVFLIQIREVLNAE